jgi:anti-sigma B factor antagonist
MRGLTIAQSTLPDTGWDVLAVAGEVDLATVPELERAVKGVLEDGSENLVIDLGDTTFMDSTGLRVLITADRDFKQADRELAILVKPGPISRLIDVSGMHELLHVIENTAELAR